MNRGKIIKHIIQAVEESQPENHKIKVQTDSEIVNQVYEAVKPNASIAARSARRRAILSGDFFGENFIFFLELLIQCGLEINFKREGRDESKKN